MTAALSQRQFKELFSAIEQCGYPFPPLLMISPFPRVRVLAEAERRPALYSLLQHLIQLQIRFFIAFLP
jgi:hypothetical protein